MAQDLEYWRKEIQALDTELIRLVEKRMSLALKIGEFKALHKLPVKNHEVEQENLERSRAQARSLGLDPAFIEQLMILIMQHSVETQVKLG